MLNSEMKKVKVGDTLYELDVNDPMGYSYIVYKVVEVLKDNKVRVDVGSGNIEIHHLVCLDFTMR